MNKISNHDFHFEIHRDLASLREIAPEWDRLAAAVTFPSVFGLHSFQLAWLKSFEKTWAPRVIIGRDKSGHCRLIAPFAEHRDSTGPRRWVSVGHGAADYEGLLVDAADTAASEAFAQWLETHLPCAVLELNHLARREPQLNSIERQSSRWRNLLGLLTSPYPLSYSVSEEQHAFLTRTDLQTVLSKTSGRDYRKHENWFNRQAPLTYTRIAEPKEIARELDAFRRLHIKKWEAKKQSSLLLLADHWDFVQSLPQALQSEGAARMDLLKWGGRTIAAHFGFEWKARLYWYLTAYDPEVGSHSPGKLLLARVLQEAHTQQLDEVDFLRGDEGYKSHYASHRRLTWRVTLYRSRSALLSRWWLRRWESSY